MHYVFIPTALYIIKGIFIVTQRLRSLPGGKEPEVTSNTTHVASPDSSIRKCQVKGGSPQGLKQIFSLWYF